MATCEKNLTFEECELTILRHAVDQAEKKNSKNIIGNPQIKHIIRIVETFLKNKKLICYGGTAINNLLPAKYQFYDKALDLPDYDFYSPSPIDDAKELADIYYENGFVDVEAKAGMHYGTYKVYVNFMPIADITYLNPSLFEAIKKDAIIKKDILYAPVNFLRMSMYLELSRPSGDVSRWEKVLKRLILLNIKYPLKGKKCEKTEIQRKFESPKNKVLIFDIIRKTVSKHNGIFFGGYASALYSQYMPDELHKQFTKTPDFDVLSEEPEILAQEIREALEKNDIKDVKIFEHSGIGEIISPHYEVMIGEETVIFIYEPLACHSYNVIRKNNLPLKIATIDTMLSFYLAFLYADRNYYDKNRILCMSQYLFDVQHDNRLKQQGILKRFSMNCYGKQRTMISMREQKAEKYKQLKHKKNSREYKEWFLNYNPALEREKMKDKARVKRLKETIKMPNKSKNKKTRRKKNKL